MFITNVIGQLKLVKWDNFLHPLFTGCGRIWMDVHAFGHFRIGLAGNHPAAGKGKEEGLANSLKSRSLSLKSLQLTYCEIYNDNHRQPQYPVVEYISPWHPSLIHEISFAGTFVWKWNPREKLKIINFFTENQQKNNCKITTLNEQFLRIIC